MYIKNTRACLFANMCIALAILKGSCCQNVSLTKPQLFTCQKENFRMY